MAVLNEKARYAGEHIMWEDGQDGVGAHSREVLDIAGGQGLILPGTVLGLVAANGGGISSAVKAAGPNTGNGTNGSLSVVARTAMLGIYRVRMTSATAFTVTDPLGRTVGSGTAGTPFAGGQIVFTITAGGTPFVAGDGFDMTVTAVPLTYVPSPDTGANGSQVAVALNLYEADTANGPIKVTGHVRAANVNGKVLVYHSTVNDAAKRAAKAAQLAAVGIIVR